MIDKVAELRNEIARSIRAVRLSCFGRKCLRECIRRMAAAAPHHRATRRRWGAAVAAVLWCLGAFAADGDRVKCVWDPQSREYFCSGYGSVVEVVGGGGSSEVVTNFLGSCTNCINTTPAECLYIKQTVTRYYDQIQQGLGDILDKSTFVQDQIDAQLNDIGTFRRFGAQTQTGIWDVWDYDFVPYVQSVNNTQTSLVSSEGFSPNVSLSKALRLVGFNDGIYDYANSYSKPNLESMKGKMSEIDDLTSSTREKVQSLFDTVDQRLNCEACPSTGTNDCNECTGGRWCTEEQGDAIITLLEDTKDFVEKMQGAVISISNNVRIAVQNLHDGFFTSYTHVPTEEELGHTWQELYLEGYSPNFHEYASTNILARIELLLAGMSGVLTNNSDFAEASEFAETGMSATNEFNSVRDDFTNSVGLVVQDREQNVRSVGDALIGLYNTFRGWSGTPFSRQTLINSYSIEVGEQHWDVPSFEPSQQGISIGNIIRVICRSVMSVFYILFTVLIFVRFHIAFFEWVLKYLKWAIELMQGFFS